eukprot:NODE_4231_length_841_cov_15.613636_g3905_i0.p1 GENE.NODE_4231_length_841_cov_15.613636_g3905_i0~~NODE_4231_length_841_cov_15.613636_g3905_i0.p1  ORF type:complete len:256 (+),score=36.65 NODE_4231_length_841_cov_15.613636_g3905_i0:76-768(+)
MEQLGRFTGAAQCPLCRRRDFQMRSSTAGAAMHRHECATQIQALWRGHAARVRFFRMLLDRDPSLRRAFQFGLVQQISNRCLAAAESRAKALDGFFANLDRVRVKAKLGAHSSEDWRIAREQAAERCRSTRGCEDCAICMQEMQIGESSGSGGAVSLPTIHQGGACAQPQAGEGSDSSNTVILSCSHCFHASCLRSFEQVVLLQQELGERKEDKVRCPICRAPYLSQSLV